MIAGEESGNITASAEAYCPFGGLETLYKYISSGGSFVSHTHLSNVVLLVAVLAHCTAVTLGFLRLDLPVGVPSGLDQQFKQYAAETIAWIATRDGEPQETQRKTGGRRPVSSLFEISGAWFGQWVGLLTMVSWYSGITTPGRRCSMLLSSASRPVWSCLQITLVASFFVERPWCRYACPLGAASGLLGKLSPVYLKREGDACKMCQICTKACPMGLEVHTATTIKSVRLCRLPGMCWRLPSQWGTGSQDRSAVIR